MTHHPPAPLRPVSDEHRHEPADYEVDGRKPKRKRKAKAKPATVEASHD